MAFLSDIYLPATRASGHRAHTAHRRVNWRLLLALSVNLVVWTSAIQFIRGLF